MNLHVDITYSFIREPIKLALANHLGNTITFVNSEEEASLVLGTSDKSYSKPTIILSDDPHNIILHDTCLNISPIPSNKAEMATLVLKVAELIGKL